MNIYEELFNYSKSVGWNGLKDQKDLDFESIVEIFKNMIDEIQRYRKDLEESSLILEANLEEISNTYDLLSTLLEITNVLSQSVNPFDVAMEITEIIDKNIQPEEIALFLIDEDKILTFSGSNGKRTKEFFDSYILTAKRAVMNDQIPLMVIPIGEENFQGAFVCIGKKNGAFFDAADRKLIEAASKQLKLSLSNYSYFKKELKRAVFERELTIAQEIQKSFFPTKFPDRFDVSGVSIPAHDVGGDYYDAFEKNGKLLLTIADVSGKGIGAALMMSMFRSYLRSISASEDDLYVIATSLNHLMCDELSEDKFVTSIVGILDPYDHTFEYVNAGHDPVIIIRKDGVDLFESTDPPFGIFEGHNFYRPKKIKVNEGDSIALYTDGFPESRDLRGEEYGLERLIDFLNASSKDKPREIVERLLIENKNFSRGAEQHDDMTVIVVRV